MTSRFVNDWLTHHCGIGSMRPIFAILILGVLYLGSTPLVMAQSNSLVEMASALSSDQVQALQQLSPAEQAQLAAKAGIDLPEINEVGSEESPRDAGEGIQRTDTGDDFNREFFPGSERLPMFGYEVFSGAPSTFAPVGNIPVPSNYVLGPGDSIDLQLLRERGGRYRLVINREGQLEVPDIGPVAVAGLRFIEAKALLEQTVATQLPGARTNVSLGALRSIQVFILGEAKKAGAYTVSGLSTISNALLASGGVTQLGSLRNIQLRRDGELITTLDLYDFLTAGDTSNDQRLLPGDVIFIPPVGPTVAISGAVKRPAIYEVRDDTRLADLLAMAGGFSVNADPTRATLNRIAESSPLRIASALDLTHDKTLSAVVRNGDWIKLDGLIPVVRDQVEVVGHVFRQGIQPFSEGARLTSVLPSLVELKPFADLDYVVIKRIDPTTADISLFSASLRDAWRAPGTAVDPPLQSDDQIMVFERDKPRGAALDSAMQAVAAQSTTSRPHRFIRLMGNVKSPGTYPFEDGLTVQRAIYQLGGGLADRSYTLEAELIRYAVNDQQVRERSIIPLNLNSVMTGATVSGTLLEPFTDIFVRAIPDWSTEDSVVLEGEVLFPGTYPIAQGETLLSVIMRAGGFRDTAFLEGAFFSREQLRTRELEQARRVQADLRRDLLAQQREMIASGDQESLTQLQQLLSLSLASAEENPALGRLTIDLPRLMREGQGSELDVVLRPNDRLFVPPQAPEVTVIGEVFASSSHLYEGGLTAVDYVNYSGGFRDTADQGAVYLIRASGRAEPLTRWLSRGVRVRQGDSIIVPLKVPSVRSPLLDSLTQVTQIVYQLAVGAAAIDSLSRN
jgi:polysaccharide export outer membrane protein